jgi:hypothetical protein
MKGYLIEIYKRYKFIKYFIFYYKPIGFIKLIFCLRNGFFPSNYILFNLDKENYRYFVSDYKENFGISSINNKASILNNKIFFDQLISSIVGSPKILSFVYNGAVLPYGNSKVISLSSLFDYLQEEKTFILKPIDDDGGIGVVKIEYSNDNLFWNNLNITLEQFKKRFSELDNYFISETIKQNDYSNKLYEHSVNTVRLLTMLEPSSKKPFIAACAHRIGNNISKPVDNCAKGGYTASINIDTGIMGKAVNTKYEGLAPVYYTVHPDSRGPIEGVKIPYFEDLKKQAIELHDRLNFIEYIGWDFVLGQDNKWIVIEGNDSADLKLHQVHEPLLKSQDVRCFYNHHKIL